MINIIILMLFLQQPFERHPFTTGHATADKHLETLHFEGKSTFGSNGIIKIDYKTLFNGDYNQLVPVARMNYPDINHPPIYAVEENYDHVTLRSVPGYTLLWYCDIQVADKDKPSNMPCFDGKGNSITCKKGPF